MAGKNMTGTNGVMVPMMKHFLESMMTRGFDYHIFESKLAVQANGKNGKSKKRLRSLSSGEFELETGRDRLGNIDPKIVS